VEHHSAPTKSEPRVNEFYKKGCQEKTSASTGGREDFGLEIQPTAYCALDALEGCSLFCLLFLSGLALLVVTTPIGPWNWASKNWFLNGNHGSIGGSWPIAISGSPRGH